MEKLDGFLKTLGVPLQAVIDRVKADQKSPFWYQKYFTNAPKTVSLDFTTIYGEEQIEAMGAVISDGSTIPLRGRGAINKLQGEIPTIAVAREMDAKKYRDLYSLQNLPNVQDNVAYNAILNTIYDDVTYVGNAIHRRVNSMALQAVSTGQIAIDKTNNPDGGVSFTLDLGMKAEQKRGVAVAWSNEDAKIIDDIKRIVEDALALGKSFSKILVHRTLLSHILRNKEVQSAVRGFLNLAGNVNVTYNTTLETVNGFLANSMLPQIEVVEAVTPYAMNGMTAGVFDSWKKENAVFLGAERLGLVHSAFNNEQLMGNPSVYQYGDFSGVQIMRWFQQRPITEYTAGEYLAMIGYEQVANSYIIETDKVEG